MSGCRRRSDEGMTLVLCLVIVSVIGLIVSVTLVFEDTTIRAQSVYEDKREIDLAADGALDTAIGAIRYNGDFAVYDPYNTTDEHGNPRPATEQPCAGLPDFPYDSDGDGTDDVVLECTPDPESGTPAGSAGLPPEHVIFALGGALGDGRDRADAPASTDVRFCDDFHAYNGAACEAGIFIGRGNTEAGGLIVMPNGSAANEDLVVSNGSIVARSTTGAISEFVVRGGNVWARRDCERVFLQTLSGASRRDPDGAGPLGDLKCNQPEGPTTNEAEPFEEAPGWVHEWGEPMTADRDDDDDKWTNRPAVSTAAYNLPVADPIKPADCDDGFVQFQPNRRYTSVDQLNALMTRGGCDSTMFWFPPGVYYFDFEDVKTGTGEYNHWREPNGTYSQVVGGSIPHPEAGNQPGEWKACSSCAQPQKRMAANRIDPFPNAWGADRDGDGIEPHELSDPNDGNEIDGAIAAITAVSNDVVTLTWERFLTPMPQQANISEVVVRVAHTGDDPSKIKPGFPRMEIRVTGSSWCRVDLAHAGVTGAGKVRTAADGSVSIDVTTGCPGSTEGGSSNAFPTSWTPDDVNGLELEYRVERFDPPGPLVHKPLVQVDGAEVLVRYSGPPSPAFGPAPEPWFDGGCDPLLPGVQLIFGNLSRMKWEGNDNYVELCGGVGAGSGSRRDPHAIGVYGLSHEHTNPTDIASPFVSVPKPYRYYSGLQDSTWVPSVAANTTAWHDPTGHNDWSEPIGTSGTGNPAAADWWETDDAGPPGTYAMLASNSGPNPQISIRLPADSALTPPDEGAIPKNSVIEHAEVRLRYATGATASDVNAIDVNVVRADPTPPDSELGGGSSTFGGPTLPNRNPRRAITGNGTISLGSWDPAAEASWINPNPSLRPADNPNTAEDESLRWTDIYGDDDDERALVMNLNTYNGWNGARIDVTFKSPAASNIRNVVLDAIEVIIEYRPPGEPRPLRGCMTTRAVIPNDDPNVRDDAEAAVQYRGVSGIHNGDPITDAHDGDDAYAAGDDSADVGNCALMTVFSGTGGGGADNPGTKLHIAGAVYAPSAALEFSGIDNETSFVTDGVVVRHLTALRWKRGPDAPAFGGGSTTELDNRKVTLDVKDAHGTVVASAVVEFDDDRGRQPGRDVFVRSYDRRP